MYVADSFVPIVARTMRAQNERMASNDPAFAVAYLTRSIQRRFDRCCHR